MPGSRIVAFLGLYIIANVTVGHSQLCNLEGKVRAVEIWVNEQRLTLENQNKPAYKPPYTLVITQDYEAKMGEVLLQRVLEFEITYDSFPRQVVVRGRDVFAGQLKFVSSNTAANKLQLMIKKPVNKPPEWQFPALSIAKIQLRAEGKQLAEMQISGPEPRLLVNWYCTGGEMALSFSLQLIGEEIHVLATRQNQLHTTLQCQIKSDGVNKDRAYLAASIPYGKFQEMNGLHPYRLFVAYTSIRTTRSQLAKPTFRAVLGDTIWAVRDTVDGKPTPWLRVVRVNDTGTKGFIHESSLKMGRRLTTDNVPLSVDAGAPEVIIGVKG